jgi:hypothetical protein
MVGLGVLANHKNSSNPMVVSLEDFEWSSLAKMTLQLLQELALERMACVSAGLKRCAKR